MPLLLLVHVNLKVKAHSGVLRPIATLQTVDLSLEVLQVLNKAPLEVGVGQLLEEGRSLEFVDFDHPRRLDLLESIQILSEGRNVPACVFMLDD
jgi:hypothetical protein